MGKKLRSENMRKIMGKKIKILREMNNVTQVAKLTKTWINSAHDFLHSVTHLWDSRLFWP
jgi:hypothetical protein